MTAPRIELVIVGQPTQAWAGSTQLRIGRLPELEVAIDDVSISRRHAEVALLDEDWVVRDLGSTNGTHLNGVRVGRTPQRIKSGDVVRVGDIDLRVKALEGQHALPSTVWVGGKKAVHVEATSRRSWDEAVEGFDLSADRWKRDGKSFLHLMRAGYRLAHAANQDDQLERILIEALGFFKAQRAAIFQMNTAGELALRVTAVDPAIPAGDRAIPRTPAARALAGRESVLFRNCKQAAELQGARSVARGSVSSIVCAVLRSPDEAFGVLHLDRGPMQEPFSEAELYLADSLAAALALGVERQQMVERQQQLFLQTITALAQAVEMRDSYTGDHTHRVTTYALLLAEELGLSADDKQLLRAATALHDIGKIGIDDTILRKPGRLSEAEFKEMKTHVTRGADIIQMIPGLAWAMPVVRGHHERWDGTGYPDRLKGEGIPLSARVVAVADAFDAMTSDRPYRKGMSVAAAFVEIEAAAGRQFDPRCVAAFVRVRPRVEALLDQEQAYRQAAEKNTGTMSVRELRRQMDDSTPGRAGLPNFSPPLAEPSVDLK